MSDYIYDGTLEGMLTAIAVALSNNETPDKICKQQNYQHSLFGITLQITSDHEQAKVVWHTLKTKTSINSCRMIHLCFLSEIEGIEMDILRYIQLVQQTQFNIEYNYNHDLVLKLHKLQRKVSQDVHRIKMFVRFSKTKDNIYFASIEPDYDTLLLAEPFFRDRFADQKWVIYDAKRKYGLFYDLNRCDIVTFSDSKIHPVTGKLDENTLTIDEDIYQELWRCYFKHTTIKERKNIKLHRQFMPRRFWKHITEKQ